MLIHRKSDKDYKAEHMVAGEVSNLTNQRAASAHKIMGLNHPSVCSCTPSRCLYHRKPPIFSFWQNLVCVLTKAVTLTLLKRPMLEHFKLQLRISRDSLVCILCVFRSRCWPHIFPLCFVSGRLVWTRREKSVQLHLFWFLQSTFSHST